MSLFERFIAEGNEKADGLAQEGAMMDGVVWRRYEEALSSRKERRFMQHRNMQLVLLVWWKNEGL